jgi:hypothetical protein
MLAARQRMLRLSLSPGRARNGLPSDRVAPTLPYAPGGRTIQRTKTKTLACWEATGDPTCRVGTDCCMLARPTPRWRRTTQFPQLEDMKFPHVHHHPDVVNPALIISTGTEGPGAIA